MFRYKFYNWRSDKEYIWSKKDVRLVEFCVAEGEQVSSDAPQLFRYLPVDMTMPESALSEQLKDKKTQAESALQIEQKNLASSQAALLSFTNTRKNSVLLMTLGLLLAVPAALVAMPKGALIGLGAAFLFVMGVKDVGGTRLKKVFLKTQALNLRDEIARVQACIERYSTELTTLENTMAANVTAARNALQLFEAHALTAVTKVQPFTLLDRAHPGSLVKVSAQEVREAKADNGQNLYFSEYFPEPIEQDPALMPGRFCLFRVLKINKDGIYLSRSRAYLSAQQEDS